MKKLRLLPLLAASLFAANLQAEVILPFVFTDHMILQQKSTLHVEGTATPSATVLFQTTWTHKTLTAIADAGGRWSLDIATPKAGGPYRMTFSDGTPTVIDDVLVGEVWLASGQSNMEMPVAGWGKVLNYEEEIRNASYPSIRLFKSVKTTSVKPQSSVRDELGGWQPCTPQTVPEFSALGYFYARQLWQTLKVPVGIIDTTWGGTTAEAWTSAATLATVTGFEEQIAAMKALGFDYDRIHAAYLQQREAWLQEMDKGSNCHGDGWQSPTLDDGGWKTIDLPQYFDAREMQGFDGVVYFRRTVALPASWAGREVQLDFGPIDDEDITWWNGHLVQHGYGYNSDRHYTVPAEWVAGDSVQITIRVKDNGGEGGVAGRPEQMAARCGSESIPLAGIWRYAIGYDTRLLPWGPLSPDNSSHPTVLYNAMIHPYLSFPIQGVIWYQGCANVGRATQYEPLFQALIHDWRKQFGRPDLPFYFVQLANYLERRDLQPDSEWALLREAQSRALVLPNTGMVTNIDLGEAYDIHPKNKQAVARRLAAIALRHTYGRKVECCAPAYENYKVNGNSIQIYLTKPEGSTPIADADNLPGFIIAGPDRRFHIADASVRGGVITVSSADVAMPIAVRYGWADNPDCRLYTRGGFPVAPFRTDNW